MWDQAEVTRWERHAQAMVRSCAQDDPEALAELVRISQWLATDGLREAVAGQRARGYSWAEIAGPLGVTRQSAQERFGRPRAEAS